MPAPYTNVPEESGAITSSTAKTLRHRAVKIMRTRGVVGRARGKRK